MNTVDVLAQEDADRGSRRQSLVALGLAVLAAGAANAGVSEAKKGNTCKKKAKKRCNADAEACKPLVASICQMDPVTCLAAQNCCDECSANGFVTCLATVIPPN